MIVLLCPNTTLGARCFPREEPWRREEKRNKERGREREGGREGGREGENAASFSLLSCLFAAEKKLWDQGTLIPLNAGRLTERRDFNEPNLWTVLFAFALSNTNECSESYYEAIFFFFFETDSCLLLSSSRFLPNFIRISSVLVSSPDVEAELCSAAGHVFGGKRWRARHVVGVEHLSLVFFAREMTLATTIIFTENWAVVMATAFR